MRRLLLSAAAAFVLCTSGCLLNIYSPDPNVRVVQLLNQSEDLRNIGYEWQRIWFTDHPSHLTYDRVDGGLQ
jgi:hypothetical protein